MIGTGYQMLASSISFCHGEGQYESNVNVSPPFRLLNVLISVVQIWLKALPSESETHKDVRDRLTNAIPPPPVAQVWHAYQPPS